MKLCLFHATGKVSQHVEYIPFGETLVEEHTNTYQVPYKFSAKELDEETGLYYFSARYMDPKLSVFYSVDPLTEKYPGISPYAYCLNNPVKYTDPDGRFIIIGSSRDEKWHFTNGQYIYSGGKVYYRTSEDGTHFSALSEYTGELTSEMKIIINDIDKLSANSQGKAELINFFDQEGNDVTITVDEGGGKNHGGYGGIIYQGIPIKLPVDGSLDGEYAQYAPSFIVLGHEMAHLKSEKLNMLNRKAIWYGSSIIDEIFATHIENKIRTAAGMKLRNKYGFDTESNIIDNKGNSLYINKSEDYPTGDKVGIKESYNYSREIKKDENN